MADLFLGRPRSRRYPKFNIRRDIPRTSQAALTQRDCDRIANKLNSRPRKRLGYRTPEERFHGL